jgi:hypothetical protein
MDSEHVNSSQAVEVHSPLRSIALHVVPGVLIGIFYFLLRGPFLRAGFPPVFTLMLAVPVVLAPVQLGILFRAGKRATGRYTLRGVVSYLRSLPWWQYILWSVVVFAVVGAIFTVMAPVDSFLQERVFSWVPEMATGLQGGFDRSALIVTYVAVLLFGVLLGPITEELYFRGYLLPRTPGRLSLLWHSLLFAVYHVFTPWMIITRTIGMLPLAYAVRRKSLYIGIIVHVLVNSIDVVMGFAFIAQMS